MSEQTQQQRPVSWTTRRDEKARRMQAIEPWMKGSVSPSKSGPELHRRLVTLFAERFESGHEGCEGVGMHLRPLRSLCSNLSSSHRPFVSYLLNYSTNGSAPKYPWESRCIQLQAKIIVHRDFDLLLRAEVAFRRLD
jgi:hypothetical protein